MPQWKYDGIVSGAIKFAWQSRKELCLFGIVTDVKKELLNIEPQSDPSIRRLGHDRRRSVSQGGRQCMINSLAFTPRRTYAYSN